MQAIKADFHTAKIDAATCAMLEYAVKATRYPSDMTPADLDGLRAHGFRDEDILDIVHIMAYFNYINRVADCLGVEGEENEGFAPMGVTTPQRDALLKPFALADGAEAVAPHRHAHATHQSRR